MPTVMHDMAYYGYEISDNITETPEGFLICKNVPISRSGKFYYMGEEIGQSGLAGQRLAVFRSEEEIFSKDTLASFEGKPVVFLHPDRGMVTPQNAQSLGKGHVQNVRREGNFVVADLLIEDPWLIEEIKSGRLREVSNGCFCEYVEIDGQWHQVNLRANHVAVVPKGRAGSKVSIKDSDTITNVKKGVKRMSKKELQARILMALAKDGADEAQVAEAMALFDSTPTKTEEKANDDGLMAKIQKLLAGKEAKDEATALDTRLDKMEKALSELGDVVVKALAKDEDPDEEKEEKAEDEDEEEEKKAEDEDSDEEEETAEDEDEEEEKEAAKDAAALKQLIKDIKPLVAKLPKDKQKTAKDALNKAMGKKASSSKSYSKIKSATASHGKTAKDSQRDLSELGKQWAEKYNPHYKKQA